jgi:undecaprenyl-diphosphatase
MSLLQTIVLGIIQGLTEFLPISSSAHLAVIPQLLGWPDQGQAFDIALHAGTLAAILLYFWRDWLQILGGVIGVRVAGDAGIERNRQLFWWLVLATLPVGVVGFLFGKQAEAARSNLYLIGAMLIGIGFFMWWGERAGRRLKDLGSISATDAIAIGASQALSVIPGTSRSGVTIATGLLRDLDRPTAARFSFLLSTPAIAAAAAKDAWDLFRHGGGLPPDLRTAFLLGILVSAVTGCLVIRFFLDFLRHRSLAAFVWYRVIFGLIVIALATFRPQGS